MSGLARERTANRKVNAGSNSYRVKLTTKILSNAAVRFFFLFVY